MPSTCGLAVSVAVSSLAIGCFSASATGAFSSVVTGRGASLISNAAMINRYSAKKTVDVSMARKANLGRHNARSFPLAATGVATEKVSQGLLDDDDLVDAEFAAEKKKLGAG